MDPTGNNPLGKFCSPLFDVIFLYGRDFHLETGSLAKTPTCIALFTGSSSQYIQYHCADDNSPLTYGYKIDFKGQISTIETIMPSILSGKPTVLQLPIDKIAPVHVDNVVTVGNYEKDKYMFMTIVRTWHWPGSFFQGSNTASTWKSLEKEAGVDLVPYDWVFVSWPALFDDQLCTEIATAVSPILFKKSWRHIVSEKFAYFLNIDIPVSPIIKSYSVDHRIDFCLPYLAKNGESFALPFAFALTLFNKQQWSRIMASLLIENDVIIVVDDLLDSTGYDAPFPRTMLHPFIYTLVSTVKPLQLDPQIADCRTIDKEYVTHLLSPCGGVMFYVLSRSIYDELRDDFIMRRPDGVNDEEDYRPRVIIELDKATVTQTDEVMALPSGVEMGFFKAIDAFNVLLVDSPASPDSSGDNKPHPGVMKMGKTGRIGERKASYRANQRAKSVFEQVIADVLYHFKSCYVSTEKPFPQNHPEFIGRSSAADHKSQLFYELFVRTQSLASFHALYKNRFVALEPLWNRSRKILTVEQLRLKRPCVTVHCSFSTTTQPKDVVSYMAANQTKAFVVPLKKLGHRFEAAVKKMVSQSNDSFEVQYGAESNLELSNVRAAFVKTMANQLVLAACNSTDGARQTYYQQAMLLYLKIIRECDKSFMQDGQLVRYVEAAPVLRNSGAEGENGDAPPEVPSDVDAVSKFIERDAITRAVASHGARFDDCRLTFAKLHVTFRSLQAALFDLMLRTADTAASDILPAREYRKYLDWFKIYYSTSKTVPEELDVVLQYINSPSEKIIVITTDLVMASWNGGPAIYGYICVTTRKLLFLTHHDTTLLGSAIRLGREHKVEVYVVCYYKNLLEDFPPTLDKQKRVCLTFWQNPEVAQQLEAVGESVISEAHGRDSTISDDFKMPRRNAYSAVDEDNGLRMATFRFRIGPEGRAYRFYRTLKELWGVARLAERMKYPQLVVYGSEEARVLDFALYISVQTRKVALAADSYGTTSLWRKLNRFSRKLNTMLANDHEFDPLNMLIGKICPYGDEAEQHYISSISSVQANGESESDAITPPGLLLLGLHGTNGGSLMLLDVAAWSRKWEEFIDRTTTSAASPDFSAIVHSRATSLAGTVDKMAALDRIADKISGTIDKIVASSFNETRRGIRLVLHVPAQLADVTSSQPATQRDGIVWFVDESNNLSYAPLDDITAQTNVVHPIVDRQMRGSLGAIVHMAVIARSVVVVYDTGHLHELAADTARPIRAVIDVFDLIGPTVAESPPELRLQNNKKKKKKLKVVWSVASTTDALALVMSPASTLDDGDNEEGGVCVVLDASLRPILRIDLGFSAKSVLAVSFGAPHRYRKANMCVFSSTSRALYILRDDSSVYGVLRATNVVGTAKETTARQLFALGDLVLSTAPKKDTNGSDSMGRSITAMLCDGPFVLWLGFSDGAIAVVSIAPITDEKEDDGDFAEEPFVEYEMQAFHSFTPVDLLRQVTLPSNSLPASRNHERNNSVVRVRCVVATCSYSDFPVLALFKCFGRPTTRHTHST